MNIVTRSRYGRQAVGNMTRDIQQARNFVIPTGSVFSIIIMLLLAERFFLIVDPEVKQRIDEAIKEMKREIILCDEERRGLDEELKKIDQEDAVFRKRMVGWMEWTVPSLLIILMSRPLSNNAEKPLRKSRNVA